MNILATQYTLKTKSFEIYVAGCSGNPHCEGCHNPESWSFDCGEPYMSEYSDMIKNKVKEFSGLVDNVWILGGEPLDQNLSELLKLISSLYKICQDNSCKLWLFTRYSLDEVKEKLGDFMQYFDYVKCGRYQHELQCKNNIQYGITLATSNQKIHKKGIDY